MREAHHSPYSDPGPHGALLRAVPPEIPAISAVARNVIAHYRGEAAHLPASSREDINLRWLADQLTVDQARHGCALDSPRPLEQRLQGCCRDHSLFAVGVLREHGVPARTRVGFAGYFNPGFHHDHVVAEMFDGGRWVRFDPELGPGFSADFDGADMPSGLGTPFETAAQVWLAHRAGTIDVSRYGVDPHLPLRGEWFVHMYVIYEVAHRFADELLLWDTWGAMDAADGPGLAQTPSIDASDLALVDQVAELLVAADAHEEAHGGDGGPAAAALEALYRADARLHPSGTVSMISVLNPGAPLVSLGLR